jgi:hypothetical protein
MSLTLPQPELNESIGQFISRMLAEKKITTGQIPQAVQHFNKK